MVPTKCQNNFSGASPTFLPLTKEKKSQTNGIIAAEFKKVYQTTQYVNVKKVISSPVQYDEQKDVHRWPKDCQDSKIPFSKKVGLYHSLPFVIA